MKKKILLAAALISIFNFQFSISHAQNNPVVIEIGGRQIRQQEFMKDFMQSVGNGLVAKEATESEKRKALDEYVELYANFQAKLRDAVSRGFDTSADLRNELARYRKDLASPYLIDSAMLKKIMTEAYERNRYALHAAHILVKVGEDAPPEDTLAAYNRAMELYDQAMAGENFSNLIIAEIFRQNGAQYVVPKMVLYTDGTATACGQGSAAMGPFYCPGDQKLYIDLSFFTTMQQQLGASGDFAYAYVIAHEVGHHVENLTGILAKVHEQMSRLPEAEANKLSVRLELLADFYAGVWAHHDNKRFGSLEDGDIEEAIKCAQVIGDDYLQKKARGYAVPESFNHGTSKQRMKWFKLGLETGDMSKGTTFQCSDAEL